MFAQRNDNLLQFDDNDVGRNGFASNWALYNSSFGSGGYNLNNQTFGQEAVPLGSGLIVMLAAGGAYALVRRKRWLSFRLEWNEMERNGEILFPRHFDRSR